jgi:hypothetical protein
MSEVEKGCEIRNGEFWFNRKNDGREWDGVEEGGCTVSLIDIAWARFLNSWA